VDDRVFAREFFHPAWPADQLNQRSFAEVAGLNFHANLLSFYPRPGSGPRPDLSLTRPRATWITIDNKATTSSGKKDKQTFWVSRDAESNTFVARGNVKYAAEEAADVPVHDMPKFFARLLAERLKNTGVRVDEARVAKTDEPEPKGEIVGPVLRTPLVA